VEPVLTFAEASEHPQLKERDMIIEVPKPDGSLQKQIACPIKTSVFEPEYRHIGSKLGEHTTEVLRELGVREETISDWRRRGIIV
jgi:alpha-methylacyl-CoA racemase